MNTRSEILWAAVEAGCHSFPSVTHLNCASDLGGEEPAERQARVSNYSRRDAVRDWKYCPVGGDLRKVAKTVKEASPEGPQGKRASMKFGAGASKV